MKLNHTSSAWRFTGIYDTCVSKAVSFSQKGFGFISKSLGGRGSLTPEFFIYISAELAPQMSVVDQICS